MKRLVKNSVTSSKSTNPQGEYKYTPDILDELINFYSSQDTMSYEDIWDEIVNLYHNESLADDVLEGIDDENDAYGSENV